MKSFKEFLVENSGPRVKRVKVRFRNGKAERNIKISNVPGFKMDYGRSLVRMSATEKIHRHRGAMKARFKKKSKLTRALIKRSRTLRKRHAIGL